MPTIRQIGGGISKVLDSGTTVQPGAFDAINFTGAVTVANAGNGQVDVAYTTLGVGEVISESTPATLQALTRYKDTTGVIIEQSPVIAEVDGRLSNLTDPSGAQDAATKVSSETAAAAAAATAESNAADYTDFAVTAGVASANGYTDTVTTNMVTTGGLTSGRIPIASGAKAIADDSTLFYLAGVLGLKRQIDFSDLTNCSLGVTDGGTPLSVPKIFFDNGSIGIDSCNGWSIYADRTDGLILNGNTKFTGADHTFSQDQVAFYSANAVPGVGGSVFFGTTEIGSIAYAALDDGNGNALYCGGGAGGSFVFGDMDFADSITQAAGQTIDGVDISTLYTNRAVSSSPVTVLTTDNKFKNTAGGITYNLPAANSVASGKPYGITDTSGLLTANPGSLAPNGTDKIAGINAAVPLNRDYGIWNFYSNGTDEWIFSGIS